VSNLDTTRGATAKATALCPYDATLAPSESPGLKRVNLSRPGRRRPSKVGSMDSRTTSYQVPAPVAPSTTDELIGSAIDQVLVEVIAIVNARLLDLVAQLKAATDAVRT
jgi:hypothetical protein